MKRKPYVRTRWGGYLWKWLDEFWIWRPQWGVFCGLFVIELVLAMPLRPAAFVLEALGASVGAWVLGWQIARPEDLE